MSAVDIKTCTSPLGLFVLTVPPDRANYRVRAIQRNLSSIPPGGVYYSPTVQPVSLLIGPLAHWLARWFTGWYSRQASLLGRQNFSVCVCLEFAISLHSARRAMAAASRCPRGQQPFLHPHYMTRSCPQPLWVKLGRPNLLPRQNFSVSISRCSANLEDVRNTISEPHWYWCSGAAGVGGILRRPFMMLGWWPFSGVYN